MKIIFVLLVCAVAVSWCAPQYWYSGLPYSNNKLYPGLTYSSLPYSGLPYSGLPYAGVPYSGLPYSGVPYSGLPYAGVPYSGLPYAGVPYSLTNPILYAKKDAVALTDEDKISTTQIFPSYVPNAPTVYTYSR